MRKKIFISILLVLIFLIFIIPVLHIPNTENIEGIYNKKFKDHVVFYPQHQDDEVLWAGSAIIRALEQCGKDNVYIVLVSDGPGVNVFKSNKYKNLTRKEKQDLRDTEFKSALNDLGVKESNIIILSDLDQKEGLHYDLMKNIVLDFENKFNSVTHVAHHYKYDNHIMHRKNGRVLKKLSDDKHIKDCLYFIKPKYINRIPLENRMIYTINNQLEYSKVKSACNEYRVIDKANKKFGIGYTSAHNAFDILLKDPKLTSILVNQ